MRFCRWVTRALRTNVSSEIEGFWDTNATILLVSHDLNFLEKSCERVIWLDKGRVKLAGEASKVVDAYLEYVRQAKIYPEVVDIPSLT